MNSFVVRQKGTRNRFLEGFHGGGMSNFMSITAKGWLDFESLSKIKEYFEYMKDELLRISVEHSEKLAATKRELKKLNDFEILEVSDKKVVNVFGIENLEQFDLTNIVITKDNIHLYYEFMSDEDLGKYANILNISFKARNRVFEDLFCIDLLQIGFKFDTIKDFAIGQTIFGTKDTLKPIDEYIAEIKESSGYKEYIFKAKIEGMEKYDNDIYNLSENDNYTLNYSNSDHNRTIEDLLETLSCIEIEDDSKYELWKTNSISSHDPKYFYESISFNGSDIALLIKVIEEYISTK